MGGERRQKRERRCYELLLYFAHFHMFDFSNTALTLQFQFEVGHVKMCVIMKENQFQRGHNKLNCVMFLYSVIVVSLGQMVETKMLTVDHQ